MGHGRVSCGDTLSCDLVSELFLSTEYRNEEPIDPKEYRSEVIRNDTPMVLGFHGIHSGAYHVSQLLDVDHVAQL